MKLYVFQGGSITLLLTVLVGLLWKSKGADFISIAEKKCEKQSLKYLPSFYLIFAEFFFALSKKKDDNLLRNPPQVEQ